MSPRTSRAHLRLNNADPASIEEVCELAWLVEELKDLNPSLVCEDSEEE